ncbi:LutC/YkgG family protein [Marmoricola sp. RAF53]|uniref:LutC/YkgG family protein n=1 Tax=Marmoricola sp. RAF53 TaxID=3233059 RepID=UPI003F95E299
MSRETVLAAVRDALRTRPEVVEVDRSYRESPGPADVVGLFCERVADYRAEVHRTTPEQVTAVLAGILGSRSVLVPEGFPHALPDGVSMVVDAGLPAAELDRVAAVVTTATVGIAETGTLVLDHGPGQGRRALSLVPDLHVCVLAADQVVAGVADAIARLDPRRPQTWISGPSATSDIELSRVEGVHGPRTLHVVVLESAR